MPKSKRTAEEVCIEYAMAVIEVRIQTHVMRNHPCSEGIRSDHIDNIYPACAPCNIDKGPNDLERWRAWLGERIVDGLRRNSSTFRHAERFGRVTISAGPLVFWFERFSGQPAPEVEQ